MPGNEEKGSARGAAGNTKPTRGRPPGKNAQNQKKQTKQSKSTKQTDAQVSGASTIQTMLDYDDVWKCKTCELDFNDDDAKLMSCERCRGNYCIKCLDWSDQKYDFAANSEFMWCCPKCQRRVHDLLREDHTIDEKCRLYMNEIIERSY